MFFGGSLIFILLRKNSFERKDEQKQDFTAVKIERFQSFNLLRRDLSPKRFSTLRIIGIFASLASLCLSGVFQPSVINIIYFVGFLIFATCISCNITLMKKFAIFLKILSTILLLHITALLLYQIPWINSFFEDFSFMSILGFEKIFHIDVSRNLPVEGINSNLSIDAMLSPLVLMISYHIIVITAHFISVSFDCFQNFIFNFFSIRNPLKR